jgi:hypothetical protein
MKFFVKPWVLGLGADENRHPKNHPAEAENESAFAMEKEPQRDVKGRCHCGFSRGTLRSMRCLTN